MSGKEETILRIGSFGSFGHEPDETKVGRIVPFLTGHHCKAGVVLRAAGLSGGAPRDRVDSSEQQKQPRRTRRTPEFRGNFTKEVSAGIVNSACSAAAFLRWSQPRSRLCSHIVAGQSARQTFSHAVPPSSSAVTTGTQPPDHQSRKGAPPLTPQPKNMLAAAPALKTTRIGLLQELFCLIRRDPSDPQDPAAQRSFPPCTVERPTRRNGARSTSATARCRVDPNTRCACAR